MKSLKVGLTVFSGLLVLFILLFIVGTEANVYTKTYSLRLFVPNVSGLAQGCMVTLGGLKIGSVDRLEFARHDGVNGVDVVMIVRADYADRITHRSAAVIKTIGMLGDKYVDIAMGQPGEPPIAEDGYLTVKAGFELDEIADKLSAAMGDFTGVMSNVKTLTDDARAGKGTLGRLMRDPALANELESAARSIRQASQALTQNKGTLGRLLNDDALYTQLSTASMNLSLLSDSLRSGRGTLGRLLTEDSLYVSLHALSRNMELLAVKMNSDSSSAGAMLNTPEGYRKVSETLESFNLLVKDIRENPKKYVHVSLF